MYQQVAFYALYEYQPKFNRSPSIYRLPSDPRHLLIPWIAPLTSRGQYRTSLRYLVQTENSCPSRQQQYCEIIIPHNMKEILQNYIPDPQVESTRRETENRTKVLCETYFNCSLHSEYAIRREFPLHFIAKCLHIHEICVRLLVHSLLIGHRIDLI